MTVKITRLLTGEEVLGEMELLDDVCVITNPTVIAVMPNQKTGNVDVHMAPFAPLSSEKTVKINVGLILCQYEPVVEVLNKYNTMFGSGLIIPNSGSIATL